MNTKIFSQKNNTERGFAMLFTVMLVGIILAIAIGISEITFKQTILSNLASDSQISFYQADTGLECGMLYDYKPIGGILAGTQSIDCGGTILAIDRTFVSPQNEGVQYRFIPDGFGEKTEGCYTVTFIRNYPIQSGSVNAIEARGYNTCNQKSPRQVERALRVLY